VVAMEIDGSGWIYGGEAVKDVDWNLWIGCEFELWICRLGNGMRWNCDGMWWWYCCDWFACCELQVMVMVTGLCCKEAEHGEA
jgi:hypothetical protein